MSPKSKRFYTAAVWNVITVYYGLFLKQRKKIMRVKSFSLKKSHLHYYNHAVYMCTVFNLSYCPAGMFFCVCGELYWTLYSQSGNDKYDNYAVLRPTLPHLLGCFKGALKEDAALQPHGGSEKQDALLPQQPECHIDSPQPSKHLHPCPPSPSSSCTFTFDGYQSRCSLFPIFSYSSAHARGRSINFHGSVIYREEPECTLNQLWHVFEQWRVWRWFTWWQ